MINAMTRMSKAIREAIMAHAPHLSQVPDKDLGDYIEITEAYLGDMKAERTRRQREGVTVP